MQQPISNRDPLPQSSPTDKGAPGSHHEIPEGQRAAIQDLEKAWVREERGVGVRVDLYTRQCAWRQDKFPRR